MFVVTNQVKGTNNEKEESDKKQEIERGDSALPSSTMLRPTAYLPLDENENTLNIPRPVSKVRGLSFY